jgi:hypothetical protein
MTFIIFLPLVLIVITGLIVWFTVVPFVAVLLKKVQLSNITVVPFPPQPKLPLLIKTPPIDECKMGAIICLPKDQKNVSKLNGEGRGNV